MFYFHIQSQNFKYEIGMGEEDLLANELKGFKHSGLVLDDGAMIELMEHGGNGHIIPAKLKKDGGVTATSSVATLGQFDVLRNYMIERIKGIGRDMLDGKISAKPFKLKAKEGCLFCKYKTICRFDTTAPDNSYEQ